MNWKTLLEEIQAAGLSQSAIGERLGRSQAWVSAALSGQYADLRWSDGEALRKLHAEIVGAGETATMRRLEELMSQVAGIVGQVQVKKTTRR